MIKVRVSQMNSYVIQTPGKLYLAGEYAVVKGYYALILKTKVTLDVCIEPSDVCVIRSHQFDQDIVFQKELLHKKKTLWASALMSAYRYVSFLNKEIYTHKITIQSGLDTQQHKKLGLGSSGALTVGLIEAVLKFHDVTYTPLVLYKLSVMAQHKVHAIASYGDIATAAFKSAMLYKKFSAYNEDLEEKALNTPWEGLVITPFEPNALPLLIVHTGAQASSHALVNHAFKHMKKHVYTPLFKELDFLTRTLYERMLAHEDFKKTIEDIHKVYQSFPLEVLNQMMNEPVMKVLQLEALKTFPKKISGAGGGDNIIVYVSKKKEAAMILEALLENQTHISTYIEGVKNHE